MLKTFVLIVGLVMTLPVLAHAGHDHNSPMADFVHLVWIGSLILVATFALFQLKKLFTLLLKEKQQ